MQFLSWLHFSDLHFGMERQEWWWPTFREQLYKDLSILHDQAGPWDIVLLSGDLTQAGHQNEFEKLNSALDSLWDHFRSLGSTPQLISVPGNHDLTRPPSDSPVVKALQLWEKDEDIRKLFWSSNSNEYRELICKCFENYSAWTKNSTLPKPHMSISGFLPG
ncbi:MAG: metallophosphoesterase [Nitrospirae bacterium]|nr:metallophosphoesterase [Nitrospirota bacterium]